MKRILKPLALASLALLALTLTALAQSGGTVKSVNDTNELVMLNPRSANTNVLVHAMPWLSSSFWTWHEGDATPADTNHLDSVLYPGLGRWVWNNIGTNYFQTLVVSNLIASGFINPTDSYVPYRSNATTFADSYFYRTAGGMGIDTNLYFGPGITNILYRSGDMLVISNQTPHLKLEGLGGSFEFSWDLNTANISASGGANTVVGGPLESQTHFPGASSIYDLGLNNNIGWWRSLWQRGTNFNNAIPWNLTNYYRAADYMDGGTKVFDIQSWTNGAAGPVVGFSFRTNGVEVFNVTGTGGPSSGANWVASGTTNSTLAGTATAFTFHDTNNVLSFAGVDPTGVADSTSGIQAALTYASLTQGKVYIPSGTYKLLGSLYATNVCVEGDNSGTLLNCSTNGIFLYNSVAPYGSGYPTALRNLYLDGSSSSGSTGIVVGAVSSANFVIDRCTVANFTGAGGIGLALRDAVSVKVDNSQFALNQVNASIGGGSVTSEPIAATFENCYFRSSVDEGVLIHSGYQVQFSSGTIFEFSGKEGLKIEPTGVEVAFRIAVSNCDFEANWYSLLGNDDRTNHFALTVDGSVASAGVQVKDTSFILAENVSEKAMTLTNVVQTTLEGVDASNIYRGVQVHGASSVVNVLSYPSNHDWIGWEFYNPDAALAVLIGKSQIVLNTLTASNTVTTGEIGISTNLHIGTAAGLPSWTYPIEVVPTGPAAYSGPILKVKSGGQPADYFLQFDQVNESGAVDYHWYIENATTRFTNIVMHENRVGINLPGIPGESLEVLGNIKASGSVNAASYQINGINGWTGFWTNMIPGVITQRICISGGATTNVITL